MSCFFTNTPCISTLQSPWSLRFVLLQRWTSNMVEMFSFLIKHRMTWIGYFHSWDLIAGDLLCASYVPSLVSSSDLFSFHDTCKCLLSKILRSDCEVVRIRTHGKGQGTLLRNCFLFWPSPGMMFFLPWRYNLDLILWELGVFGVLVFSILPVWSSLESLPSLSLAEPLGRKAKESETSARSYESGLHSPHCLLCALSRH